MAYVSGQGLDEVWGVVASNSDPATASIVNPVGHATVYDDCMDVNFSKLEAGAGSIDVEPSGTYSWTGSGWTNTAYSRTEDVSAEINVKGRVIYGTSWRLKTEGVDPSTTSKSGWWRLTLFNSCGGTSPLDFTEATDTFDPTTEVAPTEGEDGGTYPRVPVIDAANDLAYIDVYIQDKASGSKGGGSGGGGGPGNGGGGGPGNGGGGGRGPGG